MRIGSVLLFIWLIIGALAAGQRGYYSGSVGTCTKAGTIAVTFIAGPLNYLGVNPKVDCSLPKPSKLAGQRYQPSSRRRASSMPKWCATSWTTVRRTWSATSSSVRQIAQIACW
jgi:hypothetical protein